MCHIMTITTITIITSDVTKLVEIRIRRNANFDFQNSSVNAKRGIYFISWNVIHWFRSSK